MKKNPLFNPLSRKVVALNYDNQSDVAEVQHLSPWTGFISAPEIKFARCSPIEEKFTVWGTVLHKDKKSILTKLINGSILKSFVCTPIKLISFGFEYWAVLTTHGTVATWGYGASGWLGHNSYTSYTSPKFIHYFNKTTSNLLQDIDYLECGGYHTLWIDFKGKVYSWGRADVGQLGLYQDQLLNDKAGIVSLVHYCI